MSVKERKAEKQRLYDLGWREADDPSDPMYEWYCDNCKAPRFQTDCPQCERCEYCYRCGSSEVREDRKGQRW